MTYSHYNNKSTQFCDSILRHRANKTTNREIRRILSFFLFAFVQLKKIEFGHVRSLILTKLCGDGPSANRHYCMCHRYVLTRNI